MTVFISHTTAAECWRSGRFDTSLGGPSISRRHRPAGAIQVEQVASMLAMDRLSITYGEALAFGTIQTCEREKLKPSARVIQTLRRGTLSFASEPIHVIVPDKSMVNNLKQLACHVRSYALPCGSFVRVEEGLLVCSPELCFANMATRIAFPQLVKLGFELCSLYTLQPGGSANYGRVLPPTTVRAIEAYLGKCPRTHGVATARKALRYISNASGSPMETALAIVLCLPPYFGGYGLPLPYLNYRIDAQQRGRSAHEKGYYLCDLYWPQGNIAIEYDSDLEHTGSSRIAEDAQRRNDLTDLGITTITATREQVMDAERLDRIAHQLGRKLHIRVRNDRKPDPHERMRLLRSLVTERDLESNNTKLRKFPLLGESR